MRRTLVACVGRPQGSWADAGIGAKIWEDMSIDRGSGKEAPDHSDGWRRKYKKGARKAMRVKMPKPRPVPMIDLMDMPREEAARLEAYEPPVDYQHEEAAALRESAAAASADDTPAAAPTGTDLVVAAKNELAQLRAEDVYPAGIELETHPHKPQRRVFRYYENFQGKGREHFPAAGQADQVPSHYFQYYRDHRLAPYENQLDLPRTAGQVNRKGLKRGRMEYGYHHGGLSVKHSQSPASFIGSNFWVKKGMVSRWKTRTWDPLATTWDMMLDEPTNPLLAAPHGRWESLPLDGETMPPDQMRLETGSYDVPVDVLATGAGAGTATEGEAGTGAGEGEAGGGAAASEGVSSSTQTFKVSPNAEYDVFPVSVTPKPGHFSKQYGMPMIKTIGPIQPQHEIHAVEKLHRAETKAVLPRDEAKGGGQDMRILCIGDSLTTGLAYGNDAGAVYKKEAWLHRDHSEAMPHFHPYAKRLHELTNAHIEVLGVHRDTTDEMRDRLWTRLQEKAEEGRPYDLVVIWGGIWDLFSPKTSADDVAQNLFRMHHVCHMHGSKTLALNLPQVSKKPLGTFVGTRLLDINKMLDDFAADRRKDMSVCDIYRLIPHRANAVSHGRSRDGRATTSHLGRLGPVYKTGAIEFSPLGYDRVAELVYKTLKHRPGFMPTAVPSRFSDNPCNDSTQREELYFRNEHEFRTGSKRRANADPDMYGSVYHTNNSEWADEDAPKEALSDEQAERVEFGMETSRLIRTPLHLESSDVDKRDAPHLHKI
eukprot:TRINITY_DN12327_c0_g1_i1.p1 TRINITY_DN12327_c0_g1~~TRINITY_DN12327_c0_g1_i1.p1  ORF type:complete len:765 (+),score=222.29 TRINITY_DN12327_c0_g1_i1:70-2364(+)